MTDGWELMAGKILLIDDNQVILDLLQRKLAKEGFEVLACRESVKAVALCREERPDLVILDILMPGKTGWEIMEELRADPATESVPIIISTVKNRPEDLERGRALQAADYIAKPYVFGDLLEKIKRILGPSAGGE